MSLVSSFDTSIIGQILVCHVAYGYNICLAYHMYVPTYIYTYLFTFLKFTYLHIGWIGLPTFLSRYPPSSTYQPR